MSLPLRARTFVGYFLALLILIAISTLSYWGATRSSRSDELVGQSYETLLRLAAIPATMREASRSGHDYLETGAPDSLDAYRSASAGLRQALQELRGLTVDNPRQQQQLMELQSLIEGRLDAEQSRIDLGGGGTAARAGRAAPAGSASDGQARIGTIVGQMAAEERRVLAARNEEQISAERMALPLAAIGSMVAIALMAMATLAANRHLAERDRAERSLRKAVEGTINAMAIVTEMRDPYTAGHQRHVSELASAIAAEMGLPAEKVEAIRMAGAIHDLGKIVVPAEILSKPGRISDLEFGIVKTHPRAAHDILKTIDLPWPLASMVLQHHERMDGSGYPSGLVGDEILPAARILAVADVVDAMSSHRPHRPSLGIDAARQEILQNRGVLYDPDTVDACLRLFSKARLDFD